MFSFQRSAADNYSDILKTCNKASVIFWEPCFLLIHVTVLKKKVMHIHAEHSIVLSSYKGVRGG